MNSPAVPILFFDGHCNLCNGTVQTVLRHDRRGLLHFASLQSDLARTLLPPRGIDPTDLNSLVLLRGERVYTESDGALETAALMGGPFALLAGLRIFPAALRNFFYRWVGRNRYRWFGRSESCLLPRPEWKARFLSR